MKNPIQLVQFIHQIARQANVNYEVHAQVDMAVKELTALLTPKKEVTPEVKPTA